MIKQLHLKSNAILSSLRYAHFFIALFAIGSGDLSGYFRLALFCVAMLNLTYQHKKLEQYSFLLYTLILLTAIVTNYYLVANHFFIICFFYCYLTCNSFLDLQKFNYPKFLLIFVLVTATVQKLLSSYFMEGNLATELLLSGVTAPWLGNIMTSNHADTVELFHTAFYSKAYGTDIIHLNLSQNYSSFFKYLTYGILAAEILISLLLLIFKPFKSYWFLLLFIAGTALLRPEYMFFSTLLFIASYDTSIKNTTLQKVLLWASVLFLAVSAFSKLALFQ